MKFMKKCLLLPVITLLAVLLPGGIKTAKASDTIAVGDLSSVFAWISVMQLEEEGRLSLDEDIRSYLPDGFFKYLKYDEPVTLLHIMNGNAGWELCYKESAADSLSEYLKNIEPVQIYEPGFVRLASDYYPSLAALIVENVSGQSYETYVEENILKTAGMENTTVNYTKTGFYPADGAASTEEDMTKLMEQLLDKKTGEGGLFFDEATYDEFMGLSYKVNENVNGIAHGLKELDGETYTVGIKTEHNGNYIVFALSPEKEFGVVHLGPELIRLSEYFGEKQLVTKQTELPYTKGMNYEFIAASVRGSSCGELQGYISMRDAIVLKEPAGMSRNHLYMYYRINSLNYFGAEELIPIFEKLEQIAPYTYEDSDGGIYAVIFEDGEPVKFISENSEYVKCRWYQTLTAVNLSILYLYIDAAIAVLLLPLLFFTWVSNRRKHYRPIGSSKFILPYSLSYILLTVNNTVLLLYSYAEKSYDVYKWHFAVNYVLTVPLLIFAVIIFKLWKKSELYTKQKTGYILLTAASLIKIIYMAAWQLY